MNKIKIIYADPFTLMRQGYKNVIEENFETICVAEVNNYKDLFATLYQNTIDLLIINDVLIDGDLENNIERLRVNHGPLKIVMITINSSDKNFSFAQHYLDGCAFITRSTDTLIQVVKNVIKGQKFFQQIKPFSGIISYDNNLFYKNLQDYRQITCKICGSIESFTKKGCKFINKQISPIPYTPTEFQCQDCGKVQVDYKLSDPEYYEATEKKCDECNGELRRDKALFCSNCKTKDYPEADKYLNPIF